MAQMNMIEAIRSAHDVMMERDSSVVVLGEDVGYFGGVFRCTDGLQRKYGEHRVIDAPITEGGIVGAAIGMGVNGLRPVAEIQFADYIYPGFDQIVSELARLRYRSCGEFFSPVTIRTPCGGGIRGGQTHSQSPEGIFTHVSGIKTVMPSNPYDAKGLLIAAIESDDPVVFFEPKRIYNGPFDGDPEKPGIGLLHGTAGYGRNRAAWRRTNDRHLRHARARGNRGGTGYRRRCGSHRRSDDGATRRQDAGGLRQENRALSCRP
jgi:2-oxoisovalerate dehydrogenase E1 component beta subunit